MSNNLRSVTVEDSAYSFGSSYAPSTFPAAGSVGAQNSWSYQEDDAGSQALAGVGLHFVHEGDTTRVVKIVRGGAAARDGSINKGDELVSVNDQNVMGASLAQLRNNLLGVAGTWVQLGFSRVVPGTANVKFQVRLQRGSPEYLNRDQLEVLRRQLETAQSNLVQLRRTASGKDVEIAELSREVSNLQSLRTQLEADLAAARNAHKEEQRQRASAEEARLAVDTSAKNDRQELHRLLSESVSKIKQLQTQVNEISEARKKEAELRAREEQMRADAEARAVTLEAEVEELRDGRRKQEADHQALKFRYVELENRMRGVEANMDVEVRSRTETELRERDAIERMTEAQRQQRDLAAEIRTWVIRNQQDLEQIENLRAQVEEYAHRLNQETSRCAAEQSARRSLEERIKQQHERFEEDMSQHRSHTEDLLGSQDAALRDSNQKLVHTRIALQEAETTVSHQNAMLRAAAERQDRSDNEVFSLRAQVVELKQKLEEMAERPLPHDSVEAQRNKVLLAQRERAQSEIETLRAENEAAAQELGRVRRANGELRAELAKCEAGVETETERVKQLEVDGSRLRSSLEGKNLEIQSLTEQLNESDARARELRVALEAAERRLNHLQKLDEAVEELRGVKDAAEAESLALRRHVGVLEARARDVAVRLEAAERDNMAFEQSKIAADAEVQRVRHEITTTYAQLAEARRDLQMATDVATQEQRKSLSATAEVERLREENLHLYSQLQETSASKGLETEKRAVEAQRREEALQRVRELQDKMLSMRDGEEVEALSSELFAMRRGQQESEAKLAQLHASLEAEQWARQSSDTQRVALESELELLRSDLSASHAQLTQLKQYIARIESERVDTTATKNTIESELARVREELRKCRADEAALREERDSDRERIQQQAFTLDEMKERERELKILFEEERSRCSDMSRKYNDVNAQYDASRGQVEALKTQIDAMRAQVSSRKPASEEQLAQLGAVHQQQLEQLRREQVQQVEQLHIDNSRLRQQAAELRAQIDRLRTAEERERNAKLQLDEAKAQVEHHKAQNDTLRQMLRATQQERDEAKARVVDSLRLPPPCGVGMEIENGGGPSGKDLFVKMLVPGMSAALSRAVAVGDIVVGIGGKDVTSMSPSEIRPLVIGPRGSDVMFAFLRSGERFTVTLKRGAYGPEHAVVSGEELDGPEGLRANLISARNRPDSNDSNPRQYASTSSSRTNAGHVDAVHSEGSVEYSGALVF